MARNGLAKTVWATPLEEWTAVIPSLITMPHFARILGGLLLVGLCCQAEPLVWVSSQAQALALARSQGKRILLVAGRPGCSSCETVVNSYCEMTSPYAIKPLIESEYIPWYANIDESTDWQVYASGLGSFSLPVICWIEPNQPTTYIYRTTGLGFSSTFYKALYARASVTNAVITGVQLASGQALVGISNLTFGASVQLERSVDLSDPNGWTSVAAFTCQSKTTNWTDTVGALPRAFYRVNTSR